jgi:hypothetical protein
MRGKSGGRESAQEGTLHEYDSAQERRRFRIFMNVNEI